MGWWKRPKEAWEEHVYFFHFWGSGIIKTFHLECDAFKDIKESYNNMLTLVLWQCLFSEGIVRRLGQLVINLSNKRIELQKAKSRETSGPIDYF